MIPASTAQEFQLNSGPHNGAAIGPLRLKISSHGETVTSAIPDMGYLHRGIEKSAERIQWGGLTAFMDRVDYLAPIHCELAYALSVERLAGIEAPARAQRIRLITGEINRIGSHLYACSTMATKLGASTAGLYLLRDREKINNLFEMLCGSRLTYNYIRVGGVAFDLSEGFIEKTTEALSYLEPKLEEYRCLLLGNKIFSGRLVGVGTITTEQAWAVGLSGPNMRATGENLDLRGSRPYCGYEGYRDCLGRAGATVPQGGDSYSRFVTRLAEIQDSIDIIREALEMVRGGSYRVGLPLDFRPPAGESYAEIEGARGIFGVYVVSSGGTSPERLKIVSPSLQAVTLLPRLLRGAQLSDVPTIVSSLDIMVSEVDR